MYYTKCIGSVFICSFCISHSSATASAKALLFIISSLPNGVFNLLLSSNTPYESLFSIIEVVL